MAPPAPLSAPTTPRKMSTKDKDDIKATITMHVGNLEREWGIFLRLPGENESPSRRTREPRTKEDYCVSMIIALANRKLDVPPMAKFDKTAEKLRSGWIRKPEAERGVVPERLRDSQHPLTARERTEIIDLLHDVLEKPYREFLAKNRKRQFSRTLSNQQASPSHVDDTPLHFALSGPKPEFKRPREEQIVDTRSSFKKLKKPEARRASFSRESLSNIMPPPERGRSIVQEHKWRSANTSFESNAASSIFSFNNPDQSYSQSAPLNTQETIPDDEGSSSKTLEDQPAGGPKAAGVGAQPSSDYGAGSSFDAAIKSAVDVNGVILGTEVTAGRIDDSLSQDLMDFGIESRSSVLTEEDILQDRLADVFPRLPLALEKFSLHIMYEITRVFCFTGVSMSDISFPPNTDLEDYDVLWRTLREYPSLQGKVFPPRSERAAWDAAHTKFTHEKAGFVSGVVFGGSLIYNTDSETGPLFHFKLKPMSLDRQHRLSRRFGDDRFFEFEMLDLRGNESPAIVQTDRGHKFLLKWLVNGPHWLLGRSWKAFYCKPIRKSKKDKKEPNTHCVYFFAVAGGKLKDRSQNPPDRERIVEIDDLLKMIRLTRKNTHQPYLKLFSRTSLALSRNTPTVILSCLEIRYRDDIEDKGEVMTDGAGRISVATAQLVSGMLQNSYPPSGFQGRLGEAKGFWSVDHTDRTGTPWIEVRASQCKWKRSSVREDKHPDQHPSNRTFEVVKSSGPLKSADLNTQLFPLLMDRAIDQEKMKRALRDLMITGLTSDLNRLVESMGDPASLRKLVQERNPNISERLRFGKVQFSAGLPSIDERLTMLLDAGFSPYKLKYATELSRQLFRSKCDELKERLNITVGKSTYAYMVPDFYGILEPDEVYMDFSHFTDGISGAQGELLLGKELLVARSPAHLISDIQKVKAVAKIEFMGLKDVIIFPTKGNPSLAAKLSGGDYDGDIAWVCWEPSIVDNFVTAEVPIMPDLVAEGYIHQNSTRYEDLVKERGIETPVSYFLQKSLSFNMQQSMLGFCTNWKETFCYHQGSVSSKESTRISTLLSLLVDQAKQGYTLGDDDWKRFIADLSPGKSVNMTTPKYKQDNPGFNNQEKHIIDYLKYAAYSKVDTSLTEFEQGLPKDIVWWDEDVSAYYKWAKNEAATSGIWKDILRDLETDLEPIKNSWADALRKLKDRGGQDDKQNFQIILLDHFEKYQSVQPHTKAEVTQSLVAGSASTDLTQWSLIKASTSFTLAKNSQFAWFMAGKQLCHLKTLWSSEGDPHSIVPSMYIIYKPNNTFIKHLNTQIPKFGENVGVSNVEELEEASQD